MCTRVFWSDNGQASICSRTMDWQVSDEPQLYVSPRGLTRTSTGIGENALTWTSRHGNIALSAWDMGTSDGLNERGLATHMLYLGSAGYEARDRRPGVATMLWSQYIVDNFATVAEAIDGLSAVQIVPAEFRGERMAVHTAIEDASGDSAVIEFIDGKTVIHHGAQYTVLTNDPSYDEQLANLNRYRPFGGELPPPGDISSLDRFIRASYFLHYLPTPGTYAEAVAGAFAIARNAAVPYGAPDEDLGVYPTWWISAADVTNRVYYFESTRSPNVIWVELDRLNFAEGAPVVRLNPRNPALVGEVSGSFEPAEQPF